MGDYIWMLPLIFAATMLFSSNNEEVEFKIRILDKKLNKIMEHLGIEDENYDEELKGFLDRGEKIKAIKFFRQETGLGLKEAKEYVDELEEKYK